jgi:MraZ protein
VIFFIFFANVILNVLLNIIVGTYECKVDAKGSAVTSAFEKQLTLSLQSGFVLKRSVFNPVRIISHGRMGYNDGKNNKLNRFVKEQ